MITGAEQLSCQELVELVTSYLEGALPAADRERFDAHIATCDGCDRYLDQIRATVRTLASLPEHSLPAQARDRLLAAFRDWQR